MAGVSSATVSLLGETAHVIFDQNTVSAEALANAVTSVGTRVLDLLCYVECT